MPEIPIRENILYESSFTVDSSNVDHTTCEDIYMNMYQDLFIRPKICEANIYTKSVQMQMSTWKKTKTMNTYAVLALRRSYSDILIVFVLVLY